MWIESFLFVCLFFFFFLGGGGGGEPAGMWPKSKQELQPNYEHDSATFLTLSLPRVINFKFSLQPHRKYNITVWRTWLFMPYSDEILYQFSPPHLYISRIKGWENVLFGLGSDRVNRKNVWYRSVLTPTLETSGVVSSYVLPYPDQL